MSAVLNGSFSMFFSLDIFTYLIKLKTLRSRLYHLFITFAYTRLNTYIKCTNKCAVYITNLVLSKWCICYILQKKES